MNSSVSLWLVRETGRQRALGLVWPRLPASVIPQNFLG